MLKRIMGKPPEGGGGILVASFLILYLVCSGAQLNPEYGCPPQERILPCRCSTRDMEFQIWCSHSELPKVLAGLEAVSHYVTRPVDELILENNNLPSLPGKVFASLRVLRLMLRNNRLERVSSNWLEGLHDSLLELFVVEPDLRSLPVDSFENLEGLEAITLQSKSMKRLPKFSGLRKLRYLQVNSPALRELTPRHFEILPSLEQLHIFGSRALFRLEAGLLRDLPRLMLVNVSDCGINWIHPRAMVALPELKEISLVGNAISSAAMVGKAAADLATLAVIRLDRNVITRLEEASFVELPMLSSLYLSHNQISEIKPGSFQRVPLLRTVDLNHNRVRMIHPEFFPQRFGSGLEEMWLIGNDLSHVAELRSILEALPRLKFLDASHNRLEGIPFGAIRGHPSLERLHLSHNKLGFLQRESFSGMPALRELRLRNNSLSNILEGPFWNLPALKSLDLSQNYFRRLEPRLLANLPNLRRLDIGRNVIGVITPETFLTTPSLEYVNVSGNALSIVHPMTFHHLRNLYELDLGWNRLVEVVPGLPRSVEHLHMPVNRIIALPSPMSPDLVLPALRSLDVSSNAIERIAPGTLAGLPNLRKLDLGYNGLRVLEDGAFDGLSRLEQLDLRNNRIMSLYGRIFKPLASLMDLNLMGNRLERIRPDVFQENSRLRRLDLSRNNLAQIPLATFSNTRDLRELYLSHNSLGELPGSLHGMMALQVLDLSFNKLNILSPETLSSLTSLLELKLVRNKIKELKEGAFDRLPRLTFIDLENNDLRVIEKNAIRALPELQALRLGKNHLQIIPAGAFAELPLLQSAELQENHLREISKNAFVNVPHLLLLNISHNMLPSLEQVGLDSLRSLEVLDLSNNRLSRVASESLAAMEWLVELKMDNNRICGVQGSPFDDMPRLRVLSLRNNRMASVSENAFKRLRSNIAVLDIDGNPLSCTCGMLWLRGWLQQASADGPRCADGSLFKEIRLSRQDCMRERQVEPVIPGCEAEVIKPNPPSGSSSLADHSQSMPPWMNLKDSTSLPPLPNESEYFDNEYVDYPYENSSIIAQTNAASESLSTMPTSVDATPSPQPQLEPPKNNITTSSTENQATRNTTAPSKNAIIPPSPGSSGFTFFGVPLPSLNFNLWGNSGRKADRKTDNSAGRPGRSRYKPFPPTEPEIHRGGFVPLPRGQGGFVPIVDPRLAYRMKEANETLKSFKDNSTKPRVQEEQHPLKASDESQESIAKTSSSKTSKSSQTDKQMEVSKAKIDTAINSTLMDSKKIPIDEKKNTEMTTVSDEVRFSTTEKPTTSTARESDSLNEDTEEAKVVAGSQGEVASRIVWTTPKVATKETVKSTLKETMSTSMEMISSKKKTGFWKFEEHREPQQVTTSTVKDDFSQETTTHYDMDDRDDYTFTTDLHRPLIESTTPRKTSGRKDIAAKATQNTDASALSALLVPGGQVPVQLPTAGSRPSGRPTITKVPAPNFNPTAEHYQSEKVKSMDGSSQETDKEFGSSAKESTSKPLLEESVDIIEENPFNWYFQHYNDTNLEPFVGVGHGGVDRIHVFCFWTFLSTQVYFVFRGFQ